MSLFSEQTFLVTGASGGVGQAVARKLGEQGATICLSGRDQARLKEIAAQLPEGRGRCYPADLTAEHELKTTVENLLAENERLDALIHCAAIIEVAPIATAAPVDFERQFQTNVLAPFRLNQLLLPALVAGQGQIIFMNSSSGHTTRAGVSQYAATKHALKAIADGLREEYNESGIRVCSLFLGAIATPMQAAIRARQNREYYSERLIQPADVAEMVAAVLALPRTAEVTDLMMRPMAKA